jgi:chromosome partitioning protein
MIVIAVVNSKGGVGKTTLASALAVRAARESKRVAMVDLDPQGSLADWWARRGKSDNPCIFVGEDDPTDARDALELDGWDWVFMDGPPGHLNTLKPIIQTADFVLIPVKASLVDLLATEAAVTIALDANASFLCVLNDVNARERLADKARDAMGKQGVPLADTHIAHRVSHVQGMTVGKSAAEVNGGKDTAAAEEIDALWREVKSAAQKAARARSKGRR